MTGEKTCPGVIFLIRNPMCTTLGFNTGLIIDISMDRTELYHSNLIRQADIM